MTRPTSLAIGDSLRLSAIALLIGTTALGAMLAPLQAQTAVDSGNLTYQLK